MPGDAIFRDGGHDGGRVRIHDGECLAAFVANQQIAAGSVRRVQVGRPKQASEDRQQRRRE